MKAKPKKPRKVVVWAVVDKWFYPQPIPVDSCPNKECMEEKSQMMNRGFDGRYSVVRCEGVLR
jgi:hypothetical protein